MSGPVLLSSYEQMLKGKEATKSNLAFNQLRDNPLYFDFNQDMTNQERPWEQIEIFVPMLFDMWNETKEKMLPYFQTRKSRCEQEDMMKGIVCILAAFHWIKGTPVVTLEWEKVKQVSFPVAPINWTERLEFILLKPTQYHCFIQLDELFTELKKQYGKHIAMKKLKQNR
ncbi:YpoC family protein [Bacillus sp. NPDC077027]|uniref:YpoC family protein n=1 Tax=Bacillus sp. NPDC077027 TaxID=3390548 RepID=UPI003D08FD9A